MDETPLFLACQEKNIAKIETILKETPTVPKYFIEHIIESMGWREGGRNQRFIINVIALILKYDSNANLTYSNHELFWIAYRHQLKRIYKWILKKIGGYEALDPNCIQYFEMFRELCEYGKIDEAKQIHSILGFPIHMHLCYSTACTWGAIDILNWLDTFPEMKVHKLNRHYEHAKNGAMRNIERLFRTNYDY